MPAAKTWSTCCTSTMAAGKSRGKPLSRISRAAGPPAEEPIATKLWRLPEVRADVVSVRTRLPRWPISQPMLRILRNSGAAASLGLPTPRAGVSTTSRAPCPMASNTRLILAWRSTVTNRIAHGVSAMICRVASTPSITGMIRSIRIRSGVNSAQRCTASRPLPATHTTSCEGSKFKARRKASTARGMSLTIATLMTARPQSAPRRRPATRRRGSWPWPSNNRRRHPTHGDGPLHGLCTTPPSPATIAGEYHGARV